MTTRLDFSALFGPGAESCAVVLIEGLPVVLVPAGIHPTAVSGADDPLWSFPNGSLTISKPGGGTLDPVREVLDAGATWEVRETTKPADGTADVEPLRVDLFDADGAMTALLSAREAVTARGLAADIDGTTTTIPLDSVVGIDTAGYLHVGRETIGYTSLSGSDAIARSNMARA